MALIDDIVAHAAERLGLGGAAGRFVHEVVTLMNGGPGGLAGFLDKLEASGFGSMLRDWLAGRHQEPVPRQGVEALFGATALGGVASRIGITRDTTETAIGEILPRILPKLAPGGVVSATAVAEALLPPIHDVITPEPDRVVVAPAPAPERVVVAPPVAPRPVASVSAPPPRPVPPAPAQRFVEPAARSRGITGPIEQNPFRWALPAAIALGVGAALWGLLAPREKVVALPAALPTPPPVAAPRLAPAPTVVATPAPAVAPMVAPVAQAIPSRLWISNDDARVTASGTVRDAATRTSILDALRTTFGADRLRADIAVDPNAAAAPWLGNIGGLIDRLKARGVNALFEGNSISIGGLGSADRDSLVAGLRGLAGPGVEFHSLADRVNDLAAGSLRQASASLAGLGAGYGVRDIAAALNHGIINFDTNSAVLPAGAATLLDAAAAKLKALSGAVIEVAGYTDSTGDAAANLRLSQERADAVRTRLLAAGVPAAAITARGYGSADPIASNERAEGRFRNRRIEYRVVQGG